MVRMNYSSAEQILRNGGRHENSSGTYSIIGRIEITYPINEQESCARESLIKKMKEYDSKMYSYEFKGEEPLSSIEFIEELITKHISEKEYTLFTSAPIKYWWKNENWKLFKSIIIRRFSVDDSENDELLKTVAITNQDYKNMPHELKEKISFLVDLKKANIKTEEEFEEYVKWAKNLGIKEIIICEDEEAIIEYKQKKAQELEKRNLWQIEQIKSIGQGSSKTLHKAVEKKINVPLSVIAPQILLKAGMHLQITKAMLEGENLYKLTTLKLGDFQVVFRSKVIKNKNLTWEMARSHKYICEIK